MKGTPVMLLTVLIAINVILITYSVCRWRSNLRLETAFRHLLPKPKLPAMDPDVLRSMRKHPAYQSKRLVGRRR